MYFCRICTWAGELISARVGRVRASNLKNSDNSINLMEVWVDAAVARLLGGENYTCGINTCRQTLIR
jgi:hypothetical protein